MALPCTVASCRLLSHLCSWCMVATGSPFAHIIAHNRSHPFWLLWPWLILVSTPSRVSSSSSASACQFLQVEAAS